MRNREKVLVVWGALMFTGSLLGMTAMRVDAITPITLAGIACGNAAARVYCPLAVYDTFARGHADEIHSLGRAKSMTQQFMCFLHSEEVLAQRICSVSPHSLVTVRLPDRSLFLVPQRYFEYFGKLISERSIRVRVDRASMRSFLHMLIMLEQELAADPERAPLLVRTYLQGPDLSRPQDVRRVQRVLWALEPLAPWVDGVLSEVSSEDSEDETLSIDSDSLDATVDSSSSFSEGPASVMVNGQLIKKESLLGKAHRLGRDAFRAQFAITNGELDFTFQALTSIANFSDFMRHMYSAEELASIRVLNFSHNNIHTIPADVFACVPRVQYVLLNDNPIQTVSADALRGMESLIHLSIMNAPGIILPSDMLHHVTRLQVLCLHHCQLTSIPSLVHVPHLRVLDVSDNLLMQMPDASVLTELQTYNAMGNAITRIDLSRLPSTIEGKLRLVVLQLNDNNIGELSSSFYDAVPTAHEATISLHNNPVWEHLHAPVIPADLADTGFVALSPESREHGALIAGEVSDALFHDMCTKVSRHMHERYRVPLVLGEEVHRARSVDAIYSFLPDCGMWIYRHRVLVSAGLVLVSAGIGGGIGFMAKALCTIVARRVLVGMAIGAATGGVLTYLGLQYVIRDGQIYINCGLDSVLMTSGMRAQYIGMARIVALLSLLKQYIIATDACLNWLMRYDEYAEDPQRIHHIMTRLEEQMHLATQRLFARIDDPTTLALLHSLLAANPLTEIQKHVATDIFPVGALEGIDVTADADITWFGGHRLEMLRNAIVQMAGVARIARALIMKRYWGDIDHARLCRIIVESEPLGATLNSVVIDVLGPLIHHLGARHPHDQLVRELQHIRNAATASIELLHSFANHRAFLDSIM